MEIERNNYLRQLILRKDNGMIKIITGIRRCGKSFLLFEIFKKYLLENGIDEDHVIEIALDGIENEELRNPKVCHQNEKALNSFLRISNLDVYVTGSNSRFSVTL